jgi:hypothetical protein
MAAYYRVQKQIPHRLAEHTEYQGDVRLPWPLRGVQPLRGLPFDRGYWRTQVGWLAALNYSSGVTGNSLFIAE